MQTRLSLDGGFCVLLALLLLVLPLPWLMAAILAASVHELCHYLALRLTGASVYGLRLGLGGARMETGPLSPAQELLAAAAGPIGSALLLLLGKWMPRTALCGAIHCIYNLLPLFPLDGGRVLRSGLTLLRAEKVFPCTQHLTRILLVGLCIFYSVKLGIGVLLVGLLLYAANRKKTANFFLPGRTV